MDGTVKGHYWLILKNAVNPGQKLPLSYTLMFLTFWINGPIFKSAYATQKIILVVLNPFMTFSKSDWRILTIPCYSKECEGVGR